MTNTTTATRLEVLAPKTIGSVDEQLAHYRATMGVQTRAACSTCDGSREVDGATCTDCDDGFEPLYFRASKTDGLVHYWTSEDAFNGDGSERDALCGDALEDHSFADSIRDGLGWLPNCPKCDAVARRFPVTK